MVCINRGLGCIDPEREGKRRRDIFAGGSGPSQDHLLLKVLAPVKQICRMKVGTRKVEGGSQDFGALYTSPGKYIGKPQIENIF